MAAFDQGGSSVRGLLTQEPVNIRRTSNIMLTLLLIGFVLSLIGFTPIGGVFFLGAFCCAVVIVAEAIRIRLLKSFS